MRPMSLKVQDLSKQYKTRSEPLRVLHEVSFEIEPGQSTAILGPSGCGKSTLLQILGTLQRPSSGSVTLNGIDPFALGDMKLAAFRNEQVGFIFQDHHLLPQLSAWENVLVPAIAKAKPTDHQIARAKELIARVGLADRANHRPAELSGGERQRIAAARALINQPSLLLADEPTGNLDKDNAQVIADLLLELQSNNEEQASEERAPILVVVTHNRDLAARFDRQWELDAGMLITSN